MDHSKKLCAHSTTEGRESSFIFVLIADSLPGRSDSRLKFFHSRRSGRRPHRMPAWHVPMWVERRWLDGRNPLL